MERGELERAVIDAYRESLRERYDAVRVRQVVERAVLPDALVDALREFFLEELYPPADRRDRLDQAFEAAIGLSRSPLRLFGLTGPALRGLARLGRRAPAALRVGAATLEAHRQALYFERRLAEEAVAEGLAVAQLGGQALARIVARLPEPEVLRFRRQLIALIARLTDTGTLAATRDVFAHSLEVMQRRPELYGEAERAGFERGRRVLSAGLELFCEVRADAVRPMLVAIERIEQRWYAGITQAYGC